MAKKHGSGAVFKFADSGSVVRDLSTYVTSVEGLPGTADVAEVTGLGGPTAKSFIPGLKDAKISVKLLFDDTATTGSDAVLSGVLGLASRAFEYGPAGTATGSRKYSGNAICMAYKLSSPHNGIVSGAAEFQVDGGVTVGTY